uniref:hypothetical protein n=1 Tax=Candidatus Electrothrix sp. TaxID=2170559 RepID=UPI00405791BC
MLCAIPPPAGADTTEATPPFLTSPQSQLSNARMIPWQGVLTDEITQQNKQPPGYCLHILAGKQPGGIFYMRAVRKRKCGQIF